MNRQYSLSVGSTRPTPLVSVVMPARNEEARIAAAMKSILSQTYGNLELIVVDDYSTDRTYDVARSVCDARVVLCKKTNQPPGAVEARNLATSMARGKYIAYQDADDVSMPERLERQMDILLHASVPTAVGCWVEEQIASQSRTMKLPLEHKQIVAGFERSTRRGSVFVSATMIWSTEIARRFPERAMFRHMYDWDRLCRVHEANAVEFVNIGEALYRYILRSSGSKMQSDWVEYNIFERAMRERRQKSAREWDSLESFHKYLRRLPVQRLRWQACAMLLSAKVRLEMRSLRE